MIDGPTNPVDQGSSVTLTCSVPGDPTASVTWMKDGGDLPSSASVVNGMLTIEDVQADDAGVYTCEAPSGLSDSHTLEVGEPGKKALQ